MEKLIKFEFNDDFTPPDKFSEWKCEKCPLCGSDFETGRFCFLTGSTFEECPIKKYF